MKYTRRKKPINLFSLNAKKLVKYIFASMLALASIAILSLCLFKISNDIFDSISHNAPQRMIANIIPVLSDNTPCKNIFSSIIGYDIHEPDSILKNIIASYDHPDAKEPSPAGENIADVKPESNESYPIVETSATVGGLKGSGDYSGVYINNETSFDIDIDALLSENFSLGNEKGPLVLIVHTHTTESYTPSGQNNYTPDDSTRTQDKNYNMVRIGNVFEQIFKDSGIDVIHDESINDYPSYNGSYKKTLSIIEDYIKKYPSIRIVLDIHRDGMTKKDGTKLKVCADINGEKSSQVMVLCGSNEGGLEHNNWKENLKLGLHIQAVMAKKYPGIARPLHLVRERYNQHATTGSLILEIGTDGNTLEEAMCGAKYCAYSICDVINNSLQ